MNGDIATRAVHLSGLDIFCDDLLTKVKQRIYGRICAEHSNCNYLAWAIAQAGHGDHLEIGTLHGGSAILAALVKDKFGLNGDIYCIDPLDGYYIGTQFGCPVDWVSRLPVTPEAVKSNAEAFGLGERIHITQAKSIPFPEQLQGHTFSSVYIDGDHWGEAPTIDWQNCKDRTNRMIVFDNVDDQHPAVHMAVKIAKADPDWQCVLEAGITAVFERKSR